jgi:hypothetical protein
MEEIPKNLDERHLYREARDFPFQLLQTTSVYLEERQCELRLVISLYSFSLKYPQILMVSRFSTTPSQRGPLRLRPVEKLSLHMSPLHRS